MGHHYLSPRAAKHTLLQRGRQEVLLPQHLLHRIQGPGVKLSTGLTIPRAAHPHADNSEPGEGSATPCMISFNPRQGKSYKETLASSLFYRWGEWELREGCQLAQCHTDHEEQPVWIENVCPWPLQAKEVPRKWTSLPSMCRFLGSQCHPPLTESSRPSFLSTGPLAWEHSAS